MSDTKLKSAPVCPHCGYVHRDAWEWNFGPALDGESEGRQCDHCDGVFDCYREVSVYYTTKMPPGAPEGTTERSKP